MENFTTGMYAMEGDNLHGILIFSTTLLSISTNIYCLSMLVKQVKKFGVRALFASLAFQVLVWDFIRSLTVGLVSGISFYQPDTGFLCSILGPLTNMALRLPFFLAAGNVLVSLKRADKGSCIRRTGLAIAAIGYLISLTFAVLPFLHNNTYYPGTEGFCTYYSWDALGYDYFTATYQEVMMYDILLSVLPFLTMFLVLLMCWILALCAKKEDVTSMTSSLALMLCYLPMTIVGLSLIAQYFGMTGLEAFDMDTVLLILRLSMVIFPVSTPTLTLLLNTAYKCCSARRDTKQSELFPKRRCSVSTSILVHNIDGMPAEYCVISIPE